jgi:hypothetical protein
VRSHSGAVPGWTALASLATPYRGSACGIMTAGNGRAREPCRRDGRRRNGRRAAPSPQLLQELAARFGLLASTMRLHIMWVLADGPT